MVLRVDCGLVWGVPGPAEAEIKEVRPAFGSVPVYDRFRSAGGESRSVSPGPWPSELKETTIFQCAFLESEAAPTP